MLTVNFTEFRKNASSIFSSVEKGETVHVLRHGKEIAEIVPIYKERKDQPSWKKKRMKLSVQGGDLSRMIIGEREHSQ
ncbi:MAG: type II toxin-antitoxin system Phd/YefM family antitoxin [Gammaproteobacteria bacterium]|nr:type II toxin-antitoxin system Phd/YefM family antitoxin [Gammaproteobacteria bacterium]MBU1655322.1 type II toxin-antitoxin system Phd/YefM family antitoxin [Gammaproteobacteria bacterium]MBU1961467.1 type II toxin-antitoxin system Phd/YefM family antitoxin [Gammaproteobacteria bacterium]